MPGRCAFSQMPAVLLGDCDRGLYRGVAHYQAQSDWAVPALCGQPLAKVG